VKYAEWCKIKWGEYILKGHSARTPKGVIEEVTNMLITFSLFIFSKN